MDPLNERPNQRISAYLAWAPFGGFDRSDLAIFTDPRHRESLIQLWTDRFDAWLSLPTGLEAGTRARLLAIRLLADGIWYAESSGVFPVVGWPDHHTRRGPAGHGAPGRRSTDEPAQSATWRLRTDQEWACRRG